MCKFLSVFLVGLFLFSCSKDEIEALKQANPKDFGFTLLELTEKKAVTIEEIKKNLQKPVSWVIKGIQAENAFGKFAEITGTTLNGLMIQFKKSGELKLSIILEKEGYVDFVLRGCTIKATLPKESNPKDFSFPLLELTGTEVTIEQIKKNLKRPSGWTVKSVQIDDGFKGFADVTGAGLNQKIRIKKYGAFAINITLEKKGYVDFVLKRTIKAMQPLKKAKPSDFSFPLFKVVGTAEIPIAQIGSTLTSPAGWRIKTIAVDDNSFAEIKGIAPYLKLIIKKLGTFTVRITLQKTGYVDYVLKGNIKAALKESGGFGFPLLTVTGKKEVLYSELQSHITQPGGWTIKNIAVNEPLFAEVIGSGSSLQIKFKKPGTFSIHITLQKTNYYDHVLKGNIKGSWKELATHPSKFYFNSGTGTITGLKDKSIKKLVIPDKINGVAVTKIGERAFENNIFLVSVTIPDSVTTIEERAFEDCSSLASVTIPDSVTKIGERAFEDCSSLASVTIPDSVTTIGGYAFYKCAKLASVTIPDSVTTIGGYAFYKCAKLTSVTIPNSVTTIGAGIFLYCTKLVVKFTQTNVSRISFILDSANESDAFGYEKYQNLYTQIASRVKGILVPRGTLSGYKRAIGYSRYSVKPNIQEY